MTGETSVHLLGVAGGGNDQQEEEWLLYIPPPPALLTAAFWLAAVCMYGPHCPEMTSRKYYTTVVFFSRDGW